MSNSEFTEYHHYLLDLARRALVCCTETQSHHTLNELLDKNEVQPGPLMVNRACFITLEKNDQLRGCIGSLKAHAPLLEDIVHNTCAAALDDHRFKAVRRNELDQISIHISILSNPEPMTFTSEQNLLEQVTPGEDGLVLSEGIRSATFLPSVWEQLPDKNDFINHLKLKAGLSAHYWSPTIECKRYHCEIIHPK